jgi:hypothetical protein
MFINRIEKLFDPLDFANGGFRLIEERVKADYLTKGPKINTTKVVSLISLGTSLGASTGRRKISAARTINKEQSPITRCD